MPRTSLLLRLLSLRRRVTLCAALASASLLGASGCVERRLLVRSDPPGASVDIDGKAVGVTPISYPFEFYGEFDVVVRHPGQLAMRRLERVYPPWWEVFPLDLVSELLVPWPLRDEHVVDVSLRRAPSELDREARAGLERRRDDLLDRGARASRELRELGPDPAIGRVIDSGNDEASP